MLRQALPLVMDTIGITTNLQSSCSQKAIRQVLHHHTISRKLMAEMKLLKGAVLDILYRRLLKNTKEMASQLNKYLHSALTLQHHSVFPPFCVYLICKATTHRTTGHTVWSVLCRCYQNTLISVSSISITPITIAQYTKLITNTLIVLTNHHKIDANSSIRAIYKKANYNTEQKLRQAYCQSV
jgi:hypothetical protein